MPTNVNHWVYRCGIGDVDQNGRRWLASETWLTTTAPSTDATEISAAVQLGATVACFGGDTIHWRDVNGIVWAERLFPSRKMLRSPPVAHTLNIATLNVNAPECAFRLQRVGAGSNPKVGRICLPILYDSSFSDLPHRRRILSSITVPINFQPTFLLDRRHLNLFGRDFYAVIYDRVNHFWTNVDHYSLLPNPIRIWQRLGPYVHGGTPVLDEDFVPPEATWLHA